VIRDAAEMRVKESDRIAALARELGRLGAAVEPRPDGMVIAGGRRFRGGRASSGGDHRIAMALAVAGLCADEPVTVDDPECIQTSFPEFETLLRRVTGV
jgi:3-phosphoshikimate 1-carboxyvinyltransferase